MRRLATAIPDVVLVELDVFDDDRGRVFESFRRDRYRDLGIGVDLEFVQDSGSSSHRGTLRGLHYQLGTPQGKLVHVVHGEIYDVAVDLRAGSPTFARHVGVTLSAANHRQLWIPPGFAHGFVVTAERAEVAYKSTAYYVPGDDRAIRWDDPELAIAWPITGAPRLSSRDAAAPLLRDAQLPTGVAGADRGAPPERAG